MPLSTHKCGQVHDLWQQLELVSELESDLGDNVNWSTAGVVHFNAGKIQLVSFGRSINSGSIDANMNGLVLKENLSLKMLELPFSSKLDSSFYVFSTTKAASKKIFALVGSMKFPSFEVVLYLCKSMNSSHINSINKTASKKIGALTCSKKFPSSELALYLYKSLRGSLLAKPPSRNWCLDLCYEVSYFRGNPRRKGLPGW